MIGIKIRIRIEIWIKNMIRNRIRITSRNMIRIRIRHSLRLNQKVAARAWLILGSLYVGVKISLRVVLLVFFMRLL